MKVKILLLGVIACLIYLSVEVSSARRHAHMGYFSWYGAIEWGFVAVGIILTAVAWLLTRNRAEEEETKRWEEGKK